jgi:hypothetical protein
LSKCEAQSSEREREIEAREQTLGHKLPFKSLLEKLTMIQCGFLKLWKESGGKKVN